MTLRKVIQPVTSEDDFSYRLFVTFTFDFQCLLTKLDHVRTADALIMV